jgi:pyruvate carboxylase
MRTVMCILNGQLRPVQVRDRSLKVDVLVAEKAVPGNPKHIAAPFAGVVTTVVEPGQHIEAGGTIGSIEAMKMEAAITTPTGGTIKRIAISSVAQVEGGDLLIELE